MILRAFSLAAQVGQSSAKQTWISDASDIANVAVGIASIGALLVAVWSVREIRRDRSIRVRPRLIFNAGGQHVPFEIEPLRGLPGINPAFASAVLSLQRPPIEHCIATSKRWSRLTNYGDGSALKARITFIVLSAQVGTETFTLDAAKLRDFPYSPDVNSIPASPSNLLPGAEAAFARIPMPIFLGPDHNRTRVDGVVIIRYQDVFDNAFSSYQEWRTSVWPKQEGHESPFIVMTFGDEYTDEMASQLLEPVLDSVPKHFGPPRSERALRHEHTHCLGRRYGRRRERPSGRRRSGRDLLRPGEELNR